MPSQTSALQTLEHSFNLIIITIKVSNIVSQYNFFDAKSINHEKCAERVMIIIMTVSVSD